MARTQVQSELLATNSISGTIIADNAITATHIATNAISGTLIQDSGIVTTMIAANNITATKVVTNAIQTRHIADDQVTADKLANSINTDIATGPAALPKAGGTMTGDLILGDNVKVEIGSASGGDLQLYHDGTHSYIDNNKGALFIRNNVDDDDNNNIILQAKSGEYSIICDDDGAVTLYHDNAAKLNTTSTGVTVTGDLFVTGSQIHTGNTAGDHSEFGTDGSGHTFIDASTSGGNIFFQQGGATKVTIASGKVGINETSPQGWLDIGTTHGVAKEVALRITNADYPNYGWDIWRDNTTGHLNFAHEDAGTDSTRVTFKAQGSVGIGTTDPDAMLEIVSADPRIRLRDNTAGGASGGGGKIEFGGYHAGSSDGTRLFAEIHGLKNNSTGGDTHGDMMFKVNTGSSSTTEVGRFNFDGVFCVGGTTPQSGDLSSTKALYLEAHESCMTIRNLTADSSSNRVSIGFLDGNGTRRGYIHVGTDGSGLVTTSDYRMKENVTPMEKGLERLLKLNPVKYKWKESESYNEGFLAHEIQEAGWDCTQTVVGEKDGEDMQSVDYGRITPLLVKAIQEQQTIIEDLKVRIETLEG